MYTLYYSPGAASLVVHWLLIDLDVPHTLARIDLAARQHKSPEYLKLNPNGVVPTLMIDGVPQYESAALVMTLADRHPEARLAPPIESTARADFYQWILHCANTLQPAFRIWFYATEAAGPDHVDLAKDHARARIEAAWERIDQHLALRGPHLLGASVSAADFLLTMLMRWSRNMPRPATQWPHLAELAARMKARPSFKLLHEREGLTEWA